MAYADLFNEKVKGLSQITKNNYLTYIRLLDEKVGQKVTSRSDLCDIMNAIIDDFNLIEDKKSKKEDKQDKRGGGMARSAYIKLLKILGMSSTDASDALVKAKEKERRILKKWVSFGVIKKISKNCGDSTLQLIIMTQYETCSRIEDVLNLKVNNIDFEDEVIRMTSLKTVFLK